LMPKGEKFYLHVFPFGFGWVTSFYHLLASVPLLNSIWLYLVELYLLWLNYVL
jgi:hypothetical protein